MSQVVPPLLDGLGLQREEPDHVRLLHPERDDLADLLRDDRALHVRERVAAGSGLLYASLGAGMMGIWSSVLFGSGGLIQWQRWQGRSST